jgi:hypothetical protein
MITDNRIERKKFKLTSTLEFDQVIFDCIEKGSVWSVISLIESTAVVLLKFYLIDGILQRFQRSKIRVIHL